MKFSLHWGRVISRTGRGSELSRSCKKVTDDFLLSSTSTLFLRILNAVGQKFLFGKNGLQGQRSFLKLTFSLTYQSCLVMDLHVSLCCRDILICLAEPG